MTFAEINVRLQANNMEFFITGSFAIHLYTGKRPDYDDIDIAIREKDIAKIESLFDAETSYRVSQFNKKYHSIKVGNVEFSTFNIETHKKTFIFGLDDKYTQYKEIAYEGLHFKIIDPEELIVLKLFHNRNLAGKRDLEDAKLIMKEVKVNLMKLIIVSYRYQVMNELVYLLAEPELQYLKVQKNWRIV